MSSVEKWYHTRPLFVGMRARASDPTRSCWYTITRVTNAGVYGTPDGGRELLATILRCPTNWELPGEPNCPIDPHSTTPHLRDWAAGDVFFIYDHHGARGWLSGTVTKLDKEFVYCRLLTFEGRSFDNLVSINRPIRPVLWVGALAIVDADMKPTPKWNTTCPRCNAPALALFSSTECSVGCHNK